MKYLLGIGFYGSVYKKIPTNVRLLMENLTGVDTPITARDFTREELIEMATLAERQKRRNLKNKNINKKVNYYYD